MTIRYMVNVGLVRATEGFVRASDAVAALGQAGLRVEQSRVVLDAQHGHGEEDTLVAVVYAVSWAAMVNQVWEVSKALDQDCIAVYDPNTAKGWLIGPQAVKWGGFNPDYFKVM